MKFGDAVMIATLIDLKHQGFVPDRDIDLVLSGDEETAMKTTALIAARFPGAALALNADGGGGRLGEDGRPQYFDLEGAEKTYADFELAFTNPGGHSSAPRKVNAIYQLARALERIGAYRFTPQENALTRAFFLAAAKRATPPLAAAMRAFAANPADPKAIAVLSAEPGYVGQIGTTCVATMIAGGHAPNALPQRASANVNCRIFPGVGVARTQAKLVEIVGDPAMKIRAIDTGTIESDASPMRPDVTQAVGRALAIDYPGVPIIPSMAAGASDNMWFRHNGVPSYGISSIFIKDSDDLSHGLNERTSIANLAPSIRYWTSLIADLSK
jgi:acetylornithine deacetylase/succinyl-diaminopimelate desuccinylase-like protein